MDQETLKALTRIGEIEQRSAEIDKERADLDGEKAALEEQVHAAGWTRTRPRKAKTEQTPAKKRGAKGAGDA